MAHAARYAAGPAPPRVAAGQAFEIDCDLANDGWLEWRSDGSHPVMVSYHWLDGTGARLPGEGLRTPLPRAVGQGASVRVNTRIVAPQAPGAYTLAIDLVEEGRTWFSERGVPFGRVAVTVF